MKKWLGLLLIVGLITSILGACGPDNARGNEEKNETSGNTEMPEKPKKLKVWVNAEEKQEDAIKEITDNYTKETGIEIDLVPVDMLEQVEKLDVEGPAGNGPDIIFQPHDRIGDLVIRGLVEPVNLEEYESEYTESALEAVQYDGEYWGFPSVVETYDMFDNKSLVDAPETMEDIMQAAENLTNTSNDEYGFLMEAANFYFTYPFFAGYGGYAFANENGNYDIQDIGLANEGYIKGGELIQTWFEEGYIPQDLPPDIMNGLFREGKVATVLNGPWMVREYTDGIGDDLGVVPLPLLDNGENPNSFIGVKSFMLSYYSDNKEWSQDLMAYMTNYDSSMIYYEVAGEIPPRNDVMEDPIIADDPI